MYKRLCNKPDYWGASGPCPPPPPPTPGSSVLHCLSLAQPSGYLTTYYSTPAPQTLPLHGEGLVCETKVEGAVLIYFDEGKGVCGLSWNNLVGRCYL